MLPSPGVAGARVIRFTERAAEANPSGRRTWRRLTAIACVLAVAATVSPTGAHARWRAQPAPARAADSAPGPAEERTEGPTEDPAAKFERAERLYAEGRYDETIALLRELIADFPDPILLYNLGRAYEGADRVAEAIDAYERYVDAAPDAPDRAAVERRIDRLRARLRPSLPPEPEPRPVAAPPQSPAPRPIVAPWVLTAIGGAGLVAGITLGGLSRARRDDAIDARIQADAAAHLRSARRLATGANVAFAVGGALAIAGVAWGLAAVVKRRRARERAQARVGS